MKYKQQSLINLIIQEEEEQTPLINLITNEEQIPLINLITNEEQTPLINLITNEEQIPLINLITPEEDNALTQCIMKCQANTNQSMGTCAVECVKEMIKH
jgi:hypothetical protein